MRRLSRLHCGDVSRRARRCLGVARLAVDELLERDAVHGNRLLERDAGELDKLLPDVCLGGDEAGEGDAGDVVGAVDVLERVKGIQVVEQVQRSRELVLKRVDGDGRVVAGDGDDELRIAQRAAGCFGGREVGDGHGSSRDFARYARRDGDASVFVAGRRQTEALD